MTVILHTLSAYPDPIAPETTASSLLLELTPAFTHRVYSFKRAGWQAGQAMIPFDDAAGKDHRAIAYGAPPKGLSFERTLTRLAEDIIADARARDIEPDVVHAHKVALDGIVGAAVARAFDVPLCLSVQANSDTKILRARRDLRPRVQQLWREAAVIFPFAPVAEDAVTRFLGPRDGLSVTLPCPTRADAMVAPQVRADGAPPVIRTAFHIAHYSNKNIETLIRATALAAEQVPDIRLEIIGGGDSAAFLRVARMAEEMAPGRVTMLGARPLDQMQALLNGATAFALLSRRESYGMVYAEALLAGTPCLYPEGRAIDGYFPDGDFTLAVDPRSVPAAAEALVRLARDEAGFKARLAQAQAAGHLDLLQRPGIAARYSAAIGQAVGETSHAA